MLISGLILFSRGFVFRSEGLFITATYHWVTCRDATTIDKGSARRERRYSLISVHPPLHPSKPQAAQTGPCRRISTLALGYTRACVVPNLKHHVIPLHLYRGLAQTVHGPGHMPRATPVEAKNEGTKQGAGWSTQIRSGMATALACSTLW